MSADSTVPVERYLAAYDDFHPAGKGADWAAVGGAIIGLLPTVLAGAAVGAGSSRNDRT